MLASINLDRHSVYISNILPCSRRAIERPHRRSRDVFADDPKTYRAIAENGDHAGRLFHKRY